MSQGDFSRQGTIPCIWMTTAEEDNNLRGLTLSIHWDTEATPSVQRPLGDLFGLCRAKAAYFSVDYQLVPEHPDDYGRFHAC